MFNENRNCMFRRQISALLIVKTLHVYGLPEAHVHEPPWKACLSKHKREVNKINSQKQKLNEWELNVYQKTDSQVHLPLRCEVAQITRLKKGNNFVGNLCCLFVNTMVNSAFIFTCFNNL